MIMIREDWTDTVFTSYTASHSGSCTHFHTHMIYDLKSEKAVVTLRGQKRGVWLWIRSLAICTDKCNHQMLPFAIQRWMSCRTEVCCFLGSTRLKSYPNPRVIKTASILVKHPADTHVKAQLNAWKSCVYGSLAEELWAHWKTEEKPRTNSPSTVVNHSRISL